MTLEEAKRRLRFWAIRSGQSGLTEDQYTETRIKYAKYANLVTFLMKSPTSQLCTVAREIAKQEDAP